MDTNAKVIAKRRTADNKPILLWSDGDITNGRVGQLISAKVPMPAAWLALDEVCLYDLSEAKALVRTARNAVKQKRSAPLVYLRNKMAGRSLKNTSRKWADQEWR